jgi:hypothetical protein
MKKLIFIILIIILGLIGEIRCAYKMITCNWEPIGKSEILYTVGTFTGLGAVIGWIDIKDK